MQYLPANFQHPVTRISPTSSPVRSGFLTVSTDFSTEKPYAQPFGAKIFRHFAENLRFGEKPLPPRRRMNHFSLASSLTAVHFGSLFIVPYLYIRKIFRLFRIDAYFLKSENNSSKSEGPFPLPLFPRGDYGFIWRLSVLRLLTEKNLPFIFFIPAIVTRAFLPYPKVPPSPAGVHTIKQNNRQSKPPVELVVCTKP